MNYDELDEDVHPGVPELRRFLNDRLGPTDAAEYWHRAHEISTNVTEDGAMTRRGSAAVTVESILKIIREQQGEHASTSASSDAIEE